MNTIIQQIYYNHKDIQYFVNNLNPKYVPKKKPNKNNIQSHFHTPLYRRNIIQKQKEEKEKYNDMTLTGQLKKKYGLTFKDLKQNVHQEQIKKQQKIKNKQVFQKSGKRGSQLFDEIVYHEIENLNIWKYNEKQMLSIQIKFPDKWAKIQKIFRVIKEIQLVDFRIGDKPNVFETDFWQKVN